MNNTRERFQSLTKDCLKNSVNFNGRALFTHFAIANTFNGKVTMKKIRIPFTSLNNTKDKQLVEAKEVSTN